MGDVQNSTVMSQGVFILQTLPDRDVSQKISTIKMVPVRKLFHDINILSFESKKDIWAVF